MKNIAIMGFKCCGKSAVARALAKKLGKPFIDLDDITTGIHEKETGERLSCREIHQKYGAGYFRSLEARAVEELPQKKDCVIALGGGVVAYSANVSLLKKHCRLVYLKDSPKDLLKRIRERGVPAFLDPKDLEGSMRKELARREPLYEKYADVKIDCVGLSVPQIVERLLGELQ
jgi:shikimate kinase